jgi:hypothetical protein
MLSKWTMMLCTVNHGAPFGLAGQIRDRVDSWHFPLALHERKGLVVSLSQAIMNHGKNQGRSFPVEKNFRMIYESKPESHLSSERKCHE